MEESEKPTFVIETPSFLGMSWESYDARISKYYNKSKSCPKIKSFYVHGLLEDELKYDICEFVSGEIKDVEVQDAKIFDLYDKSHDAKIVLVHDKENNIYGYLVSPKENLVDISNTMKQLIDTYKCI
jgi:hypothetical protein